MKRMILLLVFLFRRQIREIMGPISVEAIKADIQSKGDSHTGHVRATEFPEEERPEIFTPTTAIISGGSAVWKVEVPKYIRKHLIYMTLTIDTIRTHGLLHTKKSGKSASILVNNELVDRINLVKPHPHGEDLGVDSRRPIPITRYIKKDEDIQRIEVRVDEDVWWDIDYVTLEPIILRNEIRPWVFMVSGALISAFFGVITGELIN